MERKLFTIPNVVFIIGIGLNVGGWVRNSVYLEQRVAKLEDRMDKEAETNAQIYMRRDVMAADLAAIRESVQRQESNAGETRRQVEALRKDLR